MRARLVLHSKEIKGDEIVEIKIWELPKSAKKPHGVKFSIVYVNHGKRLLGYDNAEGKGYHRHFSGKEETYRFKDIWKLFNDFKQDLRKIRGRDWDED
jgi:hypothetical protein